MNKIRLVFRGISEIIGGLELGLLVLTDQTETRQITVVCDRQMEYQFGLRLGNAPIADKLLPEVLCQAIKLMGPMDFEVLIKDIVNGQYQAVLVNRSTFDMIPIRVSDAVLLSYISRIPIYIEQGLMMRQSVPFDGNAQGMSIPVNALNDEMLQQALDKAVEEENYELASHLRDEIKRRNNKKDERE
ncbi:MAG: bifunctional nuclease family protein [Prevotella sp.]|nr:bifunctional nuclease family protein [Prevotella sp.]